MDSIVSVGRYVSWGLSVLLAIHVVHAGPPTPRVLIVEDFEADPPNRLGGYHDKYQAGDSVAIFSRDSTVSRGAGRSLYIQADRRANGYCGVWMHFFNFKSPKRRFFDARPYSHLSFWVKGREGGEQFTIKLADRGWIEKEDSVAIGEIDQFLPKGVTTVWQEVLVPLAHLKGLDLQNLGGMTFDFTTPGQHVIFLEDVSFKINPSTATPQNAAVKGVVAKPDIPRAMWLWNSRSILDDAMARKALFQQCEAARVEQLWMQVDYKLETNDGQKDVAPSDTSVVCRLSTPGVLRQFLAEAHAARLQIHALDGHPEFALKSQHHVPLAVVDAVIEFNRESEPLQRFDGIHFDNEPYLILAWTDRTRREQIMREFLELNAECQRRVREQPGLKFGIDIPFWWQDIDPKTNRPLVEVTFGGKKKPVSHHCVDILDQVGIMNYRDSVDGADGMIAHGKELIVYADQVNGARIHMGVETFLAPPTDVWFVVGLPRKRFEVAVRGSARDLSNHSHLGNLRLRALDDGQNIHVGVELPNEPTEEHLNEARKHLLTLSEQLSVASTGGANKTQTAAMRDQVENYLRQDPEWRGFRNRDIVTPNGQELSGFTATSIMLPKITFGDDTREELAKQLKLAESSFRRSNKFVGMAIHSYESLQKLPETRQSAARPLP